MRPFAEFPSRRELLAMSGLGFGSIALQSLLQADSPQTYNRPAPAQGPLSRTGQGRHPDGAERRPEPDGSLRSKPELTKRAGQPHPDGVEIHQPDNQNILLPSSYRFQAQGQCGMQLSELLPNLAPSPTTSAWSAPCTPSTTTIPRACTCC